GDGQADRAREGDGRDDDQGRHRDGKDDEADGWWRRNAVITHARSSARAAILGFGMVGMAALASCRSDPALTAPFLDAFERAELGPDYHNTGGPYRVEGNKLVYARVHNHPLWLRRRLPHDVRVELDCASRSVEGDLKVELFGDGETFQSDQAVEQDLIYTAS